MKEAGGCVKTVPRLMSAGRKCFYQFAIRLGWESAVIVEAIFIRISSFRIGRKRQNIKSVICFIDAESVRLSALTIGLMQ